MDKIRPIDLVILALVCVAVGVATGLGIRGDTLPAERPAHVATRCRCHERDSDRDHDRDRDERPKNRDRGRDGEAGAVVPTAKK